MQGCNPLNSSFSSTLFSNNFLPHGHCYFWRPDILWLNVISDGLIALAYFSIPVILILFMLKRKDFPFPWVLVMFGAFILLCGTTHIMGIVTIWDPLYSLDGVIKGATAFVSLLTAVMLVPLIPLALALKSPKELEAANLKLADANDQLKEIDRLKDNFFSNVSHELRTPLTLILAPLESLLSNDYGSLSDAQRNNLQAMHNNSIRLFQMVNSILDFAKISAKKIEVKREPVDIVLLTESIVHEFDPVIKQKQIEVQFNCTVEKKIVNLDRYLYERILFNLLSNAAKFTPEKGSITVALSCDQNRILLSIKDNGIGISEADQKKLFQRFQQVEGSATRRFEGTGLGLALVKEFSILLGGDVRVETAVGKGSTFFVEFDAPPVDVTPQTTHKPIVSHFQKYQTAQPVPTSKVSESDTTAKGLNKILIAEDNLELATYVSSLLSDFCQTRHAADGEEAYEIIKNWHPDLVILDVMMPKKDGITLCRELKSHSQTAHIPVILLTALTHRDALLRGWEAGADEYLFKPFHPKELTTRIKLLLTYAHNNNLVQTLNRRLVISARVAGMSEVAVNVLHNLGNIVNSINVRGDLLLERIGTSHTKDFGRLIDWTKASLSDSKFMDDKEQQEKFIQLLTELNNVLIKEQNEWRSDVEDIHKYIDDIKGIIRQQQNVDEIYGVIETANLTELLDNVLMISLDKVDDIQVEKDYDHVSTALTDKMRLQDILLHLINNAKESLQESKQANKTISVIAKVFKENNKDWVEIKVSDNGLGISSENLSKIFNFGFTTKLRGHGFGLHISSLSAQKMGGRLTVESQGENAGATFILQLPLEPSNMQKWIKVTE